MAADPYRGSIHVEAPPDAVFDHFTRPEDLARWMGDRAILDPRPGGRFTVFFGERAVDGRYLEIDRPRRLVILWGRAGSKELPPGSSRLEITLRPEGGGTRVEIVHHGLPRSEVRRHVLGWSHYLARLAVAAAGGALEPHRTPPELSEGAD